MILLLLALGCGLGDATERAGEDELAVAVDVLAAVRKDPRLAGARCPQLTDPELRAQCEDIGRRPHLGDALPASAPVPSPSPGSPPLPPPPRSGDVGRSRGWVQLHPSSPPWPAPVSVSCSGAPDRVRCIEGAAVEQVRLGKDEAALARCAALPAGSRRGDCAFRAAEALVEAPQRVSVDAARRAAALCGWAAPYQADCLRHLSGDLARLAPVDASGHWGPLLERTAVVGQALGDELGAALSDEVLALGVWMHVDSRQELCVGRGIPPGLAVHARSALAWRMVEPPAALSTAAAALLQAAASEFCPSRRFPGRDYDVAGLWDALLPGEEALPRAAFLATATRLVAPDEPEIDATIAILEAAARRPDPPLDLLRQGVDHGDWRVRWTAVRLLRGLGLPVARYDDPHPLVRGRLARG